jgi:hypothetical protein
MSLCNAYNLLQFLDGTFDVYQLLLYLSFLQPQWHISVPADLLIQIPA